MREPREYEAPLCAQIGGDAWFPEAGGDNKSKYAAVQICRQCVHRLECAEWGIHYERHGIWGGLSSNDRKRIRRKRNIKLPEERIA